MQSRFKLSLLHISLLSSLVIPAADAVEVTRFKLDETSGNVATNFTGGSNGTLVNFTSVDGDKWVDGIHANALAFDGIDDHVTINDPVSNNGAYTIAFWINAPSLSNPWTRNIYTEYSQSFWQPPLVFRGYTNGTLNIFSKDNANASIFTIESQAPVHDETWHHVALVDDNGSVTLYIDGVVDTTTSYNPAAHTFSRDRSRLGAKGATPTEFFEGILDDFRTFDEALDSASVRALIHGDRIAVLRDPAIAGLDLSRIDSLVTDIQNAGYSVDTLDATQLADVQSLHFTQYHSLLLTQAPLFPMSAQANVLDFARSGGNLVLLGGILPDIDDGDNSNREGSNLLFEDDYELYNYDDATGVRASTGQTLIAPSVDITGTFSGQSALVGATPNEIKLVPILDAVDTYGRTRGLAASVALNYGGVYSTYGGAYWVLFPMEEATFYADIDIGARIVELLPEITSPELLYQAEADNAASKADTLALTTPSPKSGFVTVGVDGTSLEHDGEKLFIIGSNFIQDQFASLKTIWTEHLDVNQLDRDFTNMAAHGINAVRIFGTANLPHDAIKELARRHGVYILYEFKALDRFASTYDPIEDRQAEIQAFVNIWKDEPMLLGYDLANEPSIPQLMLVTYAGAFSPLLAASPYSNPAFDGMFDKNWVDNNAANPPSYIEIPAWATGNLALTKDLVAGYDLWRKYCQQQGYAIGSSVTGINGPLVVPPEWTTFVDLLDDTLAAWINGCTSAIRALDANHLITVGHNKSIGMLPANDALDFINYHAYDASSTGTAQSALDNATACDRYASVFPNKPITSGEFGYSNGLVQNGSVVSSDSGSIAEAVYFLNLFNNGHPGAWKWQYADLHPALLRRQWDWINYNDTATIYRNGRFGLFTFDGTDIARPKPIAHFTHFLRNYIESGGTTGTLNMTNPSPDRTPDIGYTFESPTALFIGNNEGTHPHCTFSSTKAVNVMIIWDNDEMQLMATADVSIQVTPSDLAGWSTDPALGVQNVDLLAGQIVTLAAPTTANGTPHTWLDSFGLVSGNDYEAADLADFDGDGQPASAEFDSGTDPTSAASVFKTTGFSSSGPGQFTLTWSSITGKSYRLLTNTSLNPGEWSAVESDIPATPPENSKTVFMDGSEGRFWIVEVQP